MFEESGWLPDDCDKIRSGLRWGALFVLALAASSFDAGLQAAGVGSHLLPVRRDVARLPGGAGGQRARAAPPGRGAPGRPHWPLAGVGRRGILDSNVNCVCVLK